MRGLVHEAERELATSLVDNFATAKTSGLGHLASAANVSAMIPQVEAIAHAPAASERVVREAISSRVRRSVARVVSVLSITSLSVNARGRPRSIR
jgi:hypothetical protein